MPKYQLDTTAEVPSRAALRSFTGRSSSVVISQGDDAGVFRFDESDLTSADDDLDTVVDYLGRRWKRLGLGSLSFQQSGTGAVTRTAQAKLRDIVSVFDFMTTTEIADVQAGTALVEVTTALAAAVATAGAAGKTLYFPKGTYLTGRIFPKSSTTIWMDGGVTLKKKINGINILRLTDVSDVHIFANGATLDGSLSDTANQPVVYIEGGVRCSIRDANIVGTSDAAVLHASQDCIYIGGGAVNLVSEDVHVIGGSCYNAKRNGISVVAAKRTVIEGVHVYDTTGNPGAGIDVEANAYDKLERTVIRGCNIHGGVYGVVISFSDDTLVTGNTIYDNSLDGIATSIAAQFTGWPTGTVVYRSNIDIRGVASFDTANGRITVGGDLADLPVGSQVQFSVTGAGAVPVELQGQSRYVVCQKPTSSTIIVGEMLDYNLKTSFAGAGSGTMNADPALSEVVIRCFVEGQCSNGKIVGNVLYNNTEKDIDLGLCVRFTVSGNTIYHTGSSAAIFSDQNYRVTIKDNYIVNDGGASYPIYLNQTSFPRTRANEAYYFDAGGMYVAGGSRGTFDGDLVYNCGNTGGKAVEMVKGSGLRVSRMTIFNDDLVTSAVGLSTDSTLTNSVFAGVNARGAGSSNFNSLVVGSNRADNCIRRDGAIYGGGGEVAQLVSKSTGVTLNAQAGQITMNNAALAANTVVSFTMTNSFVGANDVVLCVRKSGGAAISYEVWVDSVAAGSCVICLENRTAGSLSDAVILQFQVIPSAVS